MPEARFHNLGHTKQVSARVVVKDLLYLILSHDYFLCVQMHPLHFLVSFFSQIVIERRIRILQCLYHLANVVYNVRMRFHPELSLRLP